MIHKNKESFDKLYNDYLLLILSNNPREDYQKELAEKISKEISHLSVIDREKAVLELLEQTGKSAIILKQPPFNGKQIEYIASVINTMAFAEFAAFGYNAYTASPTNWLGFAFSTFLFISLQGLAVSILFFTRYVDGK